jgi:radical SAM superfamily enzyme YgiQ (UPF0313 family)
MRALLVMPRFTGPERNPAYPRHHYVYDFPLGLAYISAALKGAGHEVLCLNLNHCPEKDEDLVAAAVRDFDPHLCGSGGLTPVLPAIGPIFQAARRAKPTIVNVVGGGLFSSAPEIVGRLLDIDVGVIGEGENAIVEIAAAIDEGQPLDGIPGLWLRTAEGRGRRTLARPAFKDIDRLPWPDLDGFGIGTLLDVQTPVDNLLFNVEDDPRCVPMISSRSCPFNCTFCFHPNGRVYRERSLEDFFAELDDRIQRYRINLVTILDELFAVKKQRLVAFCAEMKKRPVRWLAQLHVSVVDDEVLGLMKESGCVAISWGLESMSPEILGSMNKKSTPEQNAAALAMARRHGIGMIGNFLFGDPAETEANANRTLAWWARHRHYPISLLGLRVLPGSPVWEKSVAERRFADEVASVTQPDINVTSIRDDDRQLFFHRHWVFQETVLVPGHFRGIREDGEHPWRGPLARIEWDCPACGKRNRHGSLPLKNLLIYSRARLACRGCGGTFDLPVIGLNQPPDPVREAFRVRAADLAERGKANGDFALIRSANKEYGNLIGTIAAPGVGYSPVLRQALLETALLNDQWSADRGTAAYLVGKALVFHPWDASLHARYGQLLLNEGLNGAAAMYFRTAQKLAEGDFAVPDLKMAALLNGLEAEGALRFVRLRPRTGT